MQGFVLLLIVGALFFIQFIGLGVIQGITGFVILVDPASNVTTNSGDASSFTHSHTVSGTDRLLVVEVALNNGAPDKTVSSITYAGQSLTQLTEAVNTNNNVPRVEVWYLVAPPIGTHNIVVTLDDINEVAIGAISYTGVDQTMPIDGTVTAQGTSTSVSVSVSSETNDLVQDVMASRAQGLPSVGANQTELWNVEMGGNGITNYFGAGSTEPGALSVIMNWTLTESEDWVIIGFNINAAVDEGNETNQTATTPIVNIKYPSYSSTYNETSLPLNFSVSSDNLDSCWFNINNGVNTTLLGCVNTTFTVSGDGFYNLSVYANETIEGLEGNDSLSFYVNVGKPTVHLVSPSNNNYTNNTEVQFTYIPSSDVVLTNCSLLGDFNGTYMSNQTDTGVISGVQSSFMLNLSEGNYLWGVSCSDTSTSVITGNRTLFLDMTPPNVSITEPVQGGTYDPGDVPLSFEVNDSNPVTLCSYNLSFSVGGETVEVGVISGCEDTTISIQSSGNYDLDVTAEDAAENSGSSSTSFSVSSGGGTTGGGTIGDETTGSGTAGLFGPAEISFGELQTVNIKRGQSDFISLEVLNSGSRFLNKCKLIPKGEIADWVSNNQVESLSSGQKVDFIFNINVPIDAEAKIYSAIISIVCDEIESNTILNVNILPTDFDILILSSERIGSKLRVTYSLEDFIGKDQEIVIEYSLVKENGISIFNGEEIVFLEADSRQELTLEFELPKNAFGEFTLIFDASNGIEDIKREQKVILSTRGITGFVISDANRRALYFLGIIIFSLLFLYLVVRFLHKHHKRTARHVEKGRHFIKLDLEEYEPMKRYKHHKKTIRHKSSRE